jgi:hypothetical protein
VILPGCLVYFASPGQDIRAAAIEALQHGCDTFVFNDEVYSVQLDWFSTGKISVDRGETAKGEAK